MKTFSARETVWLQTLDGIELAGFRRRAFAFLIDWSIIGIILSIAATIGTTAYIAIAKATGHGGDIHIDFGKGNVETNLDKLDQLDKSNCPTPSPTESGAPASGAPASGAPASALASGSATPPSRTQVSNAPTHITNAPPPSSDPGKHNHVKVQRLHPDESVFHEFVGEVLNIFSKVLVPCLYFGLFFWRWNGQTPGKRLMKIRVVSLVHPHMTFWHSVERALGYGAAALEAGFGFFQYWIHPYRRCAQDRLAETIVVTERSWRATFPTTPQVPDEPTVF